MERRKHIAYGYIAYTGQALARCQVDTYNRIQDRINSFIDAGMTPPERVLHGSHSLFQAIAERG